MTSPGNSTDLLSRLPPRPLRLLQQLGSLADEQHLPLYLAGGAVRDLLLKRKNWDVDLAVEGDGIAFARQVARRYKAGLAQFDRFATARLRLPDGQKIDIASTRRESYALPAALPRVKPASLEEDLRRRDFTINAMAIQLNAASFGHLHDPYGGRRDVKAKILRVLHDESFQDDPTRIFRAIRFEQRFGLRLEPATARLLAQAATKDVISRLSGPRLSNEIFLLLAERHPSRAVDSLVRLNLLRCVHRRLRFTEQAKRLFRILPRLSIWWRRRNLGSDVELPLIYLMALLSDAEPSVLRSVSQRLQLSSAQSRAVVQAGRRTDRIAAALSHQREMPASRVCRLVRGMSNEAMVLIVAKAWVVEGSDGARRCRQRIVRYRLRDRHVAVHVTGDDLAQLGLKPGPPYRQILDRVHDARLDRAVSTEAEERALVARLVKRFRTGS